MFTLIKRGILIIMAGGIFMGGFYFGRQPSVSVDALLQKGQKELAEKASNLESEARQLRVRVREYSISRRLASAETAVAERNFGIAQDELRKARRELKTLKEKAGPDSQKLLNRLEEELEEVIDEASENHPRIKEHLSSFRLKYDSTVVK